ncbi:aspartic and glutamic acid-rich protein-like [Benincasa hispida]|uniref:aspartic and glutamic acid-rich protein-like n=1 Tax=Benincasa hispida TaxID=102211 RepID=UPI001901C5E0|nr:aspartic and glutamic acid-rich protein-like [Benincasa hispida]
MNPHNHQFEAQRKKDNAESMADRSVMPRVEPYDAVHSADLDDGEKFLAGAIRRRGENSKLPPMCLRYGHILADNQPPDATSEKQQDLYCSPEVDGEVLGGQENEHGERVFEIYFSQDNHDYLVKLAFGPVNELSDEDSQQEEGELESDFYSDDGEETYEDYENDDYDEETFEDEQSDNDEELTGNRVCELYFPGDCYYVVRLVFEKEEDDDRFLEEEDEFLFKKLQRAAGISYGGDEVPAIENKSFSDLPEIVSENSRKLMELKIEDRDDIRIEYPETANEIKNGIDEDQSSGTFVDPLMILEQQNHLIARIVCDHLQLHSSA